MEITKEMLYTASQVANHQQLRVMYDAMKAERDALAAQVEDLLAHGTALATAASMATGAMDIGSPVTAFCVEAVKRFNAAKAATPQHHLRQVRADAVLDAVNEHEKKYGNSHFGRHMREYAASILAGKG